METNVCAKCGGVTVSGQLGPLQDPQLFFSEAEVKEFAGVQMVQPSGARLPVDAYRCVECGHIELSAQVPPET